VLKTYHIQMDRGASFSFTRVARDEKQRPYDLTGGEVFLSVRANPKVDPQFNLTSRDTPPEGWRTGIVIENQDEQPGAYTVTFAPEDTSELTALGHDDPWIYDVTIKLSDNKIIKDISTSNLDIYPQTGDPIPEEP
jgi:hypothetical protein